MQTPPVDPTGDNCENVGLNTKPNPPQSGPTEAVNEHYHSESVPSCLSTMTPCSAQPPAGYWERENGFVIGRSPPSKMLNSFSFEQVSEQPLNLSLPSSSPMPMRNRYRQHRQQPSHPQYYSHQMGAVAHGAVGGHGPDTPAPSSVSSIDDQVIYESDSPDDVDDSDNDDDDDDDDNSEEEDDDVFASDSVSKSFRDDSIPGYPLRVSQPIPISNPGRMNRYNNNINNNIHNNNNYNLSNDSLTFEVQPCSSYPFDDRSRHWQHLYQLRTGSEMSPELDHVGNVYIPCSWAPELRRTIGTQTHPNFRTNTLFNLAACRLRTQHHSVANAGTNQHRLRFSEGEDPMAADRQEPLPDIVPIPRNRAQSLPEVPIRRTNIRAFGQELRRISDEYYQSHNTRSRPESNRQAFSFPGADRINRVLYRILSLGRPLNADEPSDQPPPPP